MEFEISHRQQVDLPVGTVTFLMTDVEGSTRAWSTSPHDAKAALERHDRIVLEQVEKNQGYIVESGREGDSFLAVFRQASDALACALETQRSLQRESWPAGAAMKVRVAIHTGEAELRSGHYAGAPLYRCSRMLAIAHGGQVLVSGATEQLVADSLPDRVTLRDLGLHGLRDISRPEHIYQLLHPDLTGEFPPLRSVEAERSNLPEPLTSFVGRDAELSALAKLMNQARMVTITGPGGIGKSRLAVELARRRAGHWADGTWLVDLSPIQDPQQVPGAVAAAMNLGGIGRAIDVVNSWLANKRALLVLDSCEHLVAACAELCRSCLEHCRDVSILATSREALGLAGEARWPLAPLGESDALSLFEQRGQLVLPDFRITHLNQSEVSLICRGIDELPLAIELAASRLGMMSERDISKQLTDRLHMLSARRSDEPRHQTMTAAIDWSYRLLTESEAALFRRLSVFRGGFSVESAQAVCADRLVPDVLGSLGGLVEKSMVVVERLDDGETRYRLLELQAAYAEEKLGSVGETEAVLKRHYDFFFTTVTSRAGSAWAAAGAPSVLEESWRRREYNNIWAALNWARKHEPDIGLMLAGEVASIPSGDLNQARVWLAELLEHSPDQGRARMFALRGAAGIAFRQGNSQEHLRLSETLNALARDLGDAEFLVSSLHGIGAAQMDLGRLDDAEASFNQAGRLVEASGNRRQLALFQNDLGCLMLCQGRFESARRLLVDCIATIKGNASSSRGQLAATVETLANAYLGCGDNLLADETWKESLTLSIEIDDFWNVIGCVGGLARSATARGEHARAIRLGGAHSRLTEEFSCRDQPWWQQQLELSLAISRRELDASIAHDAWREGHAMNYERAIAYALES